MKSIVGDGSGDVIFEYTGRFQSFVSPYDNDTWVHLGVDISADFGDPVYAAADGVISAMWNDEFSGYTIGIKHANGYETFYRCVNEELLSEDLKVGVEVKKGQLIATVGEPNKRGREYGIYHLHFEATLNEEIIDPKEIFNVF
jgi:murein DD-endopeptidase MepM/ murein hydrolase activator NlpD